MDDSSEYFGIRVAVLGAAGFIGRWVARALCSRRAKLFLVVRDRSSAEPVFERYGVQGEILELDLEKPEAVDHLYQSVRPSITFNLAGYGVDPSERDVRMAYQINDRLVELICEGTRRNRQPGWSGPEVVHIGSALEYGSTGGYLSEDSVPSPTCLYGESKLAGTRSLARHCKTSQIRGLTARLFTVYGPGEHHNRLLPSLTRTSKTGLRLKMTSGKQKRDFTYIEDIAEGLVRLGTSEAGRGEIVNLATGRLTSVRNFAERAAKILEIPNDALVFYSLPSRPEEMEHFEVQVGRLQGLIGWKPSTSIDEGIRKTLEFTRTRDSASSGCEELGVLGRLT